MKKLYRLKESEDFKKVLDKRKCLGRDDSFSVFCARNQLGHARFGISVSTKLGDAVTRVRIRRQIRAQISLIDIYSSSYDYVIIAKNKYLERDFFENLEILKKMLKRTTIQKGITNG